MPVAPSWRVNVIHSGSTTTLRSPRLGILVCAKSLQRLAAGSTKSKSLADEKRGFTKTDVRDPQPLPETLDLSNRISASYQWFQDQFLPTINVTFLEPAFVIRSVMRPAYRRTQNRSQKQKNRQRSGTPKLQIYSYYSPKMLPKPMVSATASVLLMLKVSCKLPETPKHRVFRSEIYVSPRSDLSQFLHYFWLICLSILNRTEKINGKTLKPRRTDAPVLSSS